MRKIQIIATTADDTYPLEDLRNRIESEGFEIQSMYELNRNET